MQISVIFSHLDSLKLQWVKQDQAAVHSWSPAFRDSDLCWERGRVTRARVRAQSQSAKGMLVFLSPTGG